MKHLLCTAAFTLFAATTAMAADSTSAYQNGMKIMHQEMDIIYSGHVDSDFVRGMIPHHQGAIDMANVVLQYGKDEDIKSLARFIKVSQEGEIAQMTRWLERRGVAEPECKECEPKGDPNIEAFKSSMAVMHTNMNIAYSGDADADFVCGMIPHHQGAIDMAEILREEGSDPEIQTLAVSIIRSQNSDIARMNGWLERHNITCKLADASAMPSCHKGMDPHAGHH